MQQNNRESEPENSLACVCVSVSQAFNDNPASYLARIGLALELKNSVVQKVGYVPLGSFTAKISRLTGV